MFFTRSNISTYSMDHDSISDYQVFFRIWTPILIQFTKFGFGFGSGMIRPISDMLATLAVIRRQCEVKSSVMNM
jgi:hypothetical protein